MEFMRPDCCSPTSYLRNPTVLSQNRFISKTETPFQNPARRLATAFFAVIACIPLSCGVVTATPGDQPVGDSAKPADGEAVATLAGGCFWCTEAVFERMEGVNAVVSGYIGGHVVNPTYEQVCGKRTGHAEAVEIYYDPTKVKFEDLLEVFFKTHDPTTLNQQGADVGPQYRSGIFYHTPEQKEVAEAYIAQLNASGQTRRPIVTEVTEASVFYAAEEYHQDYYERNPNAGYCQAVVRSKVEKFDREFANKRKDAR